MASFIFAWASPVCILALPLLGLFAIVDPILVLDRLILKLQRADPKCENPLSSSLERLLLSLGPDQSRQ